jgi:hypothetical protein
LFGSLRGTAESLERETGIYALGVTGKRPGTQNERRDAPAIGSTRLPGVPPRFEIKVTQARAGAAPAFESSHFIGGRGVRTGWTTHRRAIRGKGACSGSVSRSTIFDHVVHDCDRSRHLASASESDEDSAARWHSAALFAHSAAFIIIRTQKSRSQEIETLSGSRSSAKWQPRV